MGNGSAAPFPGNGALTPQPTGTASRQSSHQGQPLPQWSNVPSALPPAATGAVPGTLDDHMKTVTEYTQQRSKALSLSSYLNRGDLSNEQRAMAQTNLDRVKVSLDALGKRLQQIMAADPTAAAAIKTHLAASQAAGQQAAMAAAAAGAAGGAADPSSNFQMQQQQLMRARNQGLARGPAPATGGNQAPPRAATPAQSQGGAAPSIVQSSHSMGLPPVNPNVPKDLISEARPEPFANVGRPTLNQGLASQPTVGSPAIVQAPLSHPSTGLPGAGLGHGGAGGFGVGLGSNAGPDPYASRALNKRKLADLVASIDPLERLEPEVEEVRERFVDALDRAAAARGRRRIYRERHSGCLSSRAAPQGRSPRDAGHSASPWLAFARA